MGPRHDRQPSGPMPALPAAPQAPASGPPVWAARWAPVVAILVGCSVLLGLAGSLADGRWQTRAQAQEQAKAEEARTDAKAEGVRQQTSADVAALKGQLTLVDARVIRLEESQRWQLYLLQQLAQRQGVPAPVPSALLPPPGAIVPMPAPQPGPP